jgi:hypothetical protein
LGAEQKAIKTTLQNLKEQKDHHALVVERAANQHGECQQQQQQQTAEQQQQAEDNNSPVTPLEEWWEVKISSSGVDLKLVLRMFDPSCGLLSKNNVGLLKWIHIHTRILPDLTEAGV